MGILDDIREYLEGEEEDRSVDYMPNRVYDDWIPCAKYSAELTKTGQVIVPSEEREQEFGSDLEPGDSYHVNLWPPSMKDERVKNYVRFDAELTQSNYITVPKDKRDEYDICSGDEVAVHLYYGSDDSTNSDG